jgi:hypothetical protein
MCLIWTCSNISLDIGQFASTSILHGTVQEYERKLHEIREKLKDIEHSHVWPFQVRNSLLVVASNSESCHQVCFSEIRSLNKLVSLALCFSIGWRQTRQHTYYGNTFSVICTIVSALDHF